MDPLSVAGLSFPLFAACIKGFVLLSTAHNLGKDSSTLICMLNLQEMQLTEWARRAGLLKEEGVLDRRLNETVVCQVLKELQDLLLNTEKLKHRYKLGLVAKSFSAQEDVPSGTSPEIHGILGDAVSNQLRSDIMYRARLIQSKNRFPQRLWWAVVDKSKFTEFINAIRSFVTELWHLYDPIHQDDMSQDLQMVLSHVIRMTSKLDQLSSLQETLQLSSEMSLSPVSQTSDSTLASAVEVKLANLRIAATSVAKESMIRNTVYELPQAWPEQNAQIENLNLDLRSLRNFMQIKGNSEMGTSKYEDETVFVEWKTLPAQSRSKIIARAHDLAALLSTTKHPDFRSLRCKGVILDTEAARIAFVYEFPSTGLSQPSAMTFPNSFQPPHSLRSLFRICPSVTDRIRLALQITKSVKYFHTAGWLHKDLRSENILLLMSEGSKPLPNLLLSRPILAGFAFSRLDSPSQISEQPSSDPERDLYRHPEAMGEPLTSFTATMDIYSLGTILLEIGEWRSLKNLAEKLVDVRKSVPTSELAKVKTFLLEEKPPGGLGMLRYRMGDVFAAVTRMMLSGEVPESFASEKDEYLAFRPDILDIAIRELGRCVI